MYVLSYCNKTIVFTDVLSNLTRHKGISDIKNSFTKVLPLKVRMNISPQHKQHPLFTQLTTLGQQHMTHVTVQQYNYYSLLVLTSFVLMISLLRKVHGIMETANLVSMASE
jgi:hypothetical protein